MITKGAMQLNSATKMCKNFKGPTALKGAHFLRTYLTIMILKKKNLMM